MHRIDTSTAQLDKFGAGKNGFTSGNPQTGEQATELNGDFFDAIQEELCAVVEGAGLVPVKGTRNQLYSAIGRLINNLALIKANNLSEIAAAGAAAQGAAAANLGLGSASKQDIGTANANIPDIQTADARYLLKNATAAAANKLATARSIAGVGFDGTGDIAIPAGNVGAYTRAEVDARINNNNGVVTGVRLGSATSISWGAENTQVNAPDGYVSTGGNLDNSAAGTQWTVKPIQIYINGNWTTIGG